MNYKLVFHILGLILRVEAVLMLPAMIIGFASGGDGPAFLYAALITLAAGQLLSLLPARGSKMQARDGFAAVALCWIVLSLFGKGAVFFNDFSGTVFIGKFQTVFI